MMHNSEVPEGWTQATLDEVTEKVPNAKPEAEPNREFGYVDISSIDNERFRIIDCKRFKGAAAPSRARRPIQPGDVLFSNVRTYLRNIAIVPEDLDAQLCSTGFALLRSNGAVEPRYLFRYLLTERFIRAVTPEQTGTHYPATSDRVVLSQRIPLPPLAEQCRIAARLEEVLAQVNATRERLVKVTTILKRFRQSVLAAACSGRLTEEWREEHPEVVSESSIPLTDNGNIPELPNLPDSWLLTTVGKIASSQYGTSARADADAGTGVPILRMSNIQDGRIDLADLKHMDRKADNIAAFTLQGGDLLFNRTNSPELVGKAAVYDLGIEAVFASYLIRLQCDSTFAISSFVAYWINSPWGRQWARQIRTDGVSQSNINASKLVAMPLPLPPLPEQHEIVRRVEALFAWANAVERRVAAATERVEKLAQATLAKAFRGELVPTEAELARGAGREYEPASALLARVRGEGKENASKAEAGRRGKRISRVAQTELL